MDRKHLNVVCAVVRDGGRFCAPSDAVIKIIRQRALGISVDRWRKARASKQP